MFGKRVVPKNLRSKRRPSTDSPTADAPPTANGPQVQREDSTPPAEEGDHAAGQSATDAATGVSVLTAASLRRPAKRSRPGAVEASTAKPSESGEKIASVVAYSGSRQLNIHDDQKATATIDCDTERGQDHRAVLERGEQIGKAILAGELERGIYRGKVGYAPAMNRREGAVAASKYTGVYGPVRGTSGVRMTMRVDFNPELCKDYKETGYCGRGDTCKFLHDRTDYKAGWQLDQEWEIERKKTQDRLQRRALRAMSKEDGGSDHDSSSSSASDESGGESSDDDSRLPFACLGCLVKWHAQSNPVVTICGHYFCQKCAMKQFTKSSKCLKCGEATDGIFNNAEDILKKASAVGDSEGGCSSAGG